jgi:hypothetical protein
MCLIKIDDQDKTNKLGKTGKGWKVFYDNDMWIEGQYYGGPYVRGERYKSESNVVEIISSDFELKTYVSGFHVYLNKKSAMLNKKQVDELVPLKTDEKSPWKVYRVKWEQPLISGKEIGGEPIVVAKYMTILE